MNNLSKYIIEKLRINKDSISEIDNTSLLDKALDEEYIKKVATVRDKYIYPESSDLIKMKAYHDKGSKPERLVSSIKDSSKLLRRFAVAIEMKWDDAINVFGQAIIDRNIWDKGDVIKYISRRYKKDNDK